MFDAEVTCFYLDEDIQPTGPIAIYAIYCSLAVTKVTGRP